MGQPVTASGPVGTWIPAGNVNTARFNSLGVTLDTNTVLVAGGMYEGYPKTQYQLASTELYDIPSNTWRTTGDMNYRRDNFTLTHLLNGQVLTVGGNGPALDGSGTTIFGSAELYNPATGIWTVTGSMALKRQYHTATLLTNGKVLVVGGDAADGIGIASADLYDPATGVWSAVGILANGRLSHTATLLNNGTVLVTGGEDRELFVPPYNPTDLPSAEIYNPATNAICQGTKDQQGFSRPFGPACDIGAYEYTVVAVAPPQRPSGNPPLPPGSAPPVPQPAGRSSVPLPPGSPPPVPAPAGR